jgi:hypothetical protein
MGPELEREHRHNLRNLRFSLPLTLLRRALLRWERHTSIDRTRAGRALAAREVRTLPSGRELPRP